MAFEPVTLLSWVFLFFFCKILDTFFEPRVASDKRRQPLALKYESLVRAGNQRILCLLFNSAQFHHYETAMTPLSETCDWAFSSALGHTLCKPSLPLLSPSIGVIW